MLRIIPRMNIDITLKEFYYIFKKLILKPAPDYNEIESFEEKFKDFLRVSDAITCSSARGCLYLILKCFNFPSSKKKIS